ncbi:MAG: aminoacyl-tRNA hydrolase [Phycisphaerae bacterium]|nr:aminoacyl-tRNA hydrolase [Phycisphaerae bacterium]
MEERFADVKFVVGLGNPGRQYRDTRHNVGFMVLKELRRRWEPGRGKRKFHARVWEANAGGQRIILAAPQTYMNRSGLAVAEMTGFYKVDPSNVLVVMDDVALATGRLRARASGSAGGHNGLNDILKVLGTNRLARLRIGIGDPPERMDPADYVLSGFKAEEKPLIAEAVKLAANAVEDWINKGITYVMDRYNHEVESSDKPPETGKHI